MAAIDDLETSRPPLEKEMHPSKPNLEVSEGKLTSPKRWRRIIGMLEKRSNIEFRGCTPVPDSDRTEMNYFNIFTLWFSMSCNPLPCVPSIHLRTCQSY